MTTNVLCMEPTALLSEIVTAMYENKYSCIIIAENNIPIGIVTERDVVHFLARSYKEEFFYNHHASDFMCTSLVAIKDDKTLFEALTISKMEKIRHLPVIGKTGAVIGVITQSNLVDAYFRVIEGATEIIEKNVEQKTKELEDANQRLRALSLEDSMMKIGNRRAMEVDLQHTHSASIRYNTEYSVALFDLDFFKKYNDYYGHPAGDALLKQVAEFLKGTVRDSDRLYRYGGEEILLLMPRTDLESAKTLAERVVQELALEKMAHEASALGYLTISGGVSCFNPPSEYPSWKEVVDKADKGLYLAKEKGRNQIGVE
ncbi:MAG: GGDEF domain-containing protein [Gammaproteobacteria bacterium]|nr:MAG: GGDEF domain-containing protein [Gammaproteobacteria bacterium]